MTKRSTRLKQYLRNCSFTLLVNPEHMNAIDSYSMPKPMARIFYGLGSGSYPENQDAYFQPPSQDAFARTVFHHSKEHTQKPDNFTSETKPAWLQRCKKTWASLVRDVHFAFLVFEAQEQYGMFDTVEFSLEADIQRGADLIIENRGKEYHVNLFVDSKKSRDFFEKKKQHRQNNKSAIDIEVPLRFRGVKQNLETQTDDLWLYDKKHLRAVSQVVNLNKNEIDYQGDTLAEVRNQPDANKTTDRSESYSD